MSEVALMIIIAVGELLISTVIGETQQRGAEQRASHETHIRSLYQAVKDRFGLAKEQLDQLANNLDIRLSQLTDTSTGSARISRASKMFREYSKAYPGLRAKVNKTKSDLTRAASNLEAKEAAAAKKIQNRGSWTDSDVVKDVYPETKDINLSISDLNKDLQESSQPEDQNVNQIDTTLQEKSSQNADSDIGEDRDGNSMTSW